MDLLIAEKAKVGMNDMEYIVLCHDHVGETFSNTSYISPELVLPKNRISLESPGEGQPSLTQSSIRLKNAINNA